MRSTKHLFHLAIPTHDLAQAAAYYNSLPGCHVARKYDDRITLNFLGDQVVCHLCPEKIDREPAIYPRHFGITFKECSEFDAFLQEVKKREFLFYKECFTRFAGQPEEHTSFFLIDPSNNLLEFKYYANANMCY